MFQKKSSLRVKALTVTWDSEFVTTGSLESYFSLMYLVEYAGLTFRLTTAFIPGEKTVRAFFYDFSYSDPRQQVHDVKDCAGFHDEKFLNFLMSMLDMLNVNPLLAAANVNQLAVSLERVVDRAYAKLLRGRQPEALPLGSANAFEKKKGRIVRREWREVARLLDKLQAGDFS